MLEISDTQKLGIGFAGFGVSFVLLGMLLFFDKGLLAIGNIFFLSGLLLVIGIGRTLGFFFQRSKLLATLLFFGGIAVVLLGWTIVGLVIELYGFVLLFGGFFPLAVNFLRRVPILSLFLNLPGLRHVLNRIAGPDPLLLEETSKTR